jgi:protein-disulfide isomerase
LRRALPAIGLALAVLLSDGAAPSGGADAAEEAAGVTPVHITLEPLEYSLGRPDAPLTIVEFTDYQCPYCRRFHAETWPRLKHDYVDRGKVRFIVRDLPLAIHPAARRAAELAHCAGAQGGFWPMHDALLSSKANLSDEEVLRLARVLKLDARQLHGCVAADRYEPAIAHNEAEATTLGLYGTPSFVIGRRDGDGVTGVRLAGAQPYDSFDALLKELLGSG